MEFQDLISSTSAIAALLCALWAYKSNRTAKLALEIAKKERNAKESNVDVYLSEIFSLTTKERKKFIVASFIFTNKSEILDSINRIEIIIDYIANNTVNNVVIGSKEESLGSTSTNKISIKNPPFVVGPRGSNGQWVGFELPKRIAENKRINSYKIELLSGSGSKILIEPKIIRELANV